ncbi:MAG TPA: tetratricopeptide repeat protein [Candidatus Melainabacteria bacterium]|jgi:tetratricopeptide (TPR) repeat protein|nr:tetratricopeptide repeat protein [Candidatus Melainabacteria bacterium]
MKEKQNRRRISASGIVSVMVAVLLSGTLSAEGAVPEQTWEGLHKHGKDNFERGNYEVSLKDFKQALDLSEKFPETDPRRGKTLNNLATVYDYLGKYSEACTSAELSVKYGEKILPPEDPTLMRRLDFLATLYLKTNKFEKSQEASERYLKFVEKTKGKDDKECARVLDNIVVSLHALKKSGEAEPYAKRALTIWERTTNEESKSVAKELSVIAGLQLDQKKYAEAEASSRRALSLFEKHYGKKDQNTAVAQASLAEILAKQGDPAKKSEADALFKQSIATLKRGKSEQSLKVTESVTKVYKDLLPN